MGAGCVKAASLMKPLVFSSAPPMGFNAVPQNMQNLPSAKVLPQSGHSPLGEASGDSAFIVKNSLSSPPQ